MFKTVIVDNALPSRSAKDMEAFLFSRFPWLVIDHSYRYTNEDRSKIIDEGFANSLCCPAGTPSDPLFNMFRIVPDIVLDKIGYTGPITITQIRPWLQMPDGQPSRPNTPHIDFRYPHLVLLQYVSDSDGDTYFLDPNDDTTIIDTVEYVPNRCVVFDGRLMHYGSTPSKKKRLVISYTLKLEKYED